MAGRCGGCQGGSDGCFMNARVWKKSSQEAKIRKLVIDAKLLKKWLRDPCFCLAKRQISSPMSQTVWIAKARRFKATRTAARCCSPSQRIEEGFKGPHPLTESDSRRS